MALSVIDGANYDLYSYVSLGKTGATIRYIRETVETLSGSSRTVVTEHKKRFNFDLLNVTTAEVAAIVVSFDKNTFAFQPLPYDSTSYTVKVIADGIVSPRSNTTAYYDITGIILEVN